MSKLAIIVVFVFAGFLTPTYAASLTEKYQADREMVLEGPMKPAFSKKLENWKGKDGFQPPVTLCLNDNPNCAQQKSLFIVEAMYAYGGVYQAQRNLAFCLGNDCFGAVIENKILSCAWRIVILASGHIEADNTDTMNLKICLNKADPVEIASIKTQAAKLYKTVYAKDIGPDWR